MSQSRLLRGTLILSAAVFFSKFLGLIFVIPFEALVDKRGLALYGYAYTPYAIILSMATLGVPMAVSKFVSKYNSLGDYETGRRLFRSGLVLMSATGFAAFLTLFFLAEPIAHGVIDPNAKDGNTIADVVLVIRLVATALLVVPVMSVIRGYFQGFQSMGPTAASQVIEQIVRILFILIGAFVALKIFHASYVAAVAAATFAAFVGALGGLAVLITYWIKRKPHLDRQLAAGTYHSNLPLTVMYKELITYAIPFVVVGLAIPFYLLVDQFTVNETLMAAGMTQPEAEIIFANLNQAVQKLVMIPVSLSTALAVTLVPTITNSYTSGKTAALHHQMTQAFQIVLFLTIPAAVGLSVLAHPVYGSLYGLENGEVGAAILRWYAPTALLFALFSITSAILQGINRQKFAVFSLLVGLLVKMMLNVPLIARWHGLGAVAATDIGFLCSVLLNVFVIRTFLQYRFGFVFKRGLLILSFSVIMAVVVVLVTWPIRGESYLRAAETTVVGVAAGGSCYLWLAYRSNLAGQILGNRFSVLRRKKRESR
ncbi:MAG TPA: polysaccharide biosynthesis protein [Bacillales bacterium]|nr:polysaccharide biosynthesis protein [Bacillales bacterium]